MESDGTRERTAEEDEEAKQPRNAEGAPRPRDSFNEAQFLRKKINAALAAVLDFCRKTGSAVSPSPLSNSACTSSWPPSTVRALRLPARASSDVVNLS